MRLFALALLLLFACSACEDDPQISPLPEDGRLVFGTVGGWVPVTYQIRGGQLFGIQGYYQGELAEILNADEQWELIDNTVATQAAIELQNDFPSDIFFNTPQNEGCPEAAVDGSCSLVAWVIPDGDTNLWVRYDGDNATLVQYVNRINSLVQQLWN